MMEIRHVVQAHETTEEIEELSVEDIYRHLDTLERFLKVIEGNKELIQRVRSSKFNMVPLLLDQKLPRDPLPADLTPGFEPNQGETGGKGEFPTAPAAEAIHPTSVAPESDGSQNIAPPSTGQHPLGGHGRTVPLTTDDTKVYFDRGLPKLSDEQYEAALKACDAVVDQDPKSADAYNNRGIVKLRHGQYETAIMDFNTAISRNSDYVPAYTNRAAAKIGLGQYKAAIRNCDAALNLNPNDAPAYTRRGSRKTPVRSI